MRPGRHAELMVYPEVSVMERTYSVPDVSCGHCKSSIEGALVPLDGVDKAEVNIEAKTASVSFDPDVVSEDAVRGAIEAAGYPIAG